MSSQAVALEMVASKSLASLRQRPSRAIVHSTTQRRGSTSSPFAVSERLMISATQRPMPANSPRSLSPTQPPSAKTCRLVRGHDRCVVDLLQRAVLGPTIEMALRRRTGREAPRQLVPPAAGGCDVEQGIDDMAPHPSCTPFFNAPVETSPVRPALLTIFGKTIDPPGAHR